MKYDPTKISIRDTPKAGTQTKAIVERIDVGTLGEFVGPEALAKWNGADPQQTAIRVCARTTEGFERKKTMPIDLDGMVHPKSNIARWKAAYGDFPTEGQEIFLIADADGYYQFVQL